MPRAYPVHLLVSGRPTLVVGAGQVAQRRLSHLVEAGAALHVVAPEAIESVRRWDAQGLLRWSPRPFERRDCQDAQLVFAATGDPAVNASVEDAARAAGAWVNRADAPERCDFWVPALALGQTCTASLSTEGRAPAAARRLSRELSQWLRAGPDRFVEAIEQARRGLRSSRRPDAGAQLRALADGPLLELCRRGDEAGVRRLLDEALTPEGSRG